MKTFKIMLGAFIIIMHGDKGWNGQESVCLQPVKIESLYPIITKLLLPMNCTVLGHQFFNQFRSEPKKYHTLYTQFVPHFEYITGNC